MIRTVAGFFIGAFAGAAVSFGNGRGRRRVAALLCGVEYAAATIRFGMGAECARQWMLFALLCAAALSDLETMEIPDRIHVMIVCVYLAFLPLSREPLCSAVRGVFGLCVAGGSMLLLSRCVERTLGREALGGGDIKLFAVLGLHYGAVGGSLLIAASSAAGLIMCTAKGIRKGEPLPFAPAIAVGAFLIAMSGKGAVFLP